ncbi:Endoplasmic reticulum, protein Pkr1 [Beauveria brongniartii RCEF 3172]|uniref:Endoplasmic reticulum, protein Pkr1 n=1 Tax=Beauveria brongniartii RCEF 3172 TaxID=1081107 RepID=A0A162LTW6_9HYPO|nr:Endoplasmic reticulum, protein Pkr1 [Beauveria brongniartii RCEF 3172]
MSSFIVELWESIFVPGPTPTILRATNATFAALQLTLFALLVGTYSIHFVVLSILSAGLWWSINWFAAELEAAKARGDLPSGGGGGGGGGVPALGDDKEAAATGQTLAAPKDGGSDEDTEVEGQAEKKRGKRGQKGGKENVVRVVKASADVEAVEAKGELKHRVASLSDSTGMSQSSASTEDEWEKVSESGNDKTK